MARVYLDISMAGRWKLKELIETDNDCPLRELLSFLEDYFVYVKDCSDIDSVFKQFVSDYNEVLNWEFEGDVDVLINAFRSGYVVYRVLV